MLQSDGSPPNWQWVLSVERRLTRLEDLVHFLLGRKTTPEKDAVPTWTPRDYMMAGAGIVMVVGALSEKSGLTAIGASLFKFYTK